MTHINIHKVLKCHWKNSGLENYFTKIFEESVLHTGFMWTQWKPLTLNLRNQSNYQDAQS